MYLPTYRIKSGAEHIKNFVTFWDSLFPLEVSDGLQKTWCRTTVHKIMQSQTVPIR